MSKYNISVSTQPVVDQQSEAKIKLASSVEMDEIMNVRWSDSNFSVDSDEDFNEFKDDAPWGATVLTDSEFLKMQEEISENSKKQVCCGINEAVGYGVFAKDAIEEGTCLGIYTGHILKRNNHNMQQFYGFGLTNSWAVDAEKVGNITRFYQHLPQRSPPPSDPNPERSITLEDYTFKNPKMRKQVATANVEARRYVYKGVTFRAFYATKPIKKYEQIGYDYGEKYWYLQNKNPFLFDKKGKVIDPSYYSVNKPITLELVNHEGVVGAILRGKMHPEEVKEKYLRDEPSIKEGKSVVPENVQSALEKAQSESAPFIIIDKVQKDLLEQEVQEQKKEAVSGKWINLWNLGPKKEVKKEKKKKNKKDNGESVPAESVASFAETPGTFFMPKQANEDVPPVAPQAFNTEQKKEESSQAKPPQEEKKSPAKKRNKKKKKTPHFFGTPPEEGVQQTVSPMPSGKNSGAPVVVGTFSQN